MSEELEQPAAKQDYNEVIQLADDSYFYLQSLDTDEGVYVGAPCDEHGTVLPGYQLGQCYPAPGEASYENAPADIDPEAGVTVPPAPPDSVRKIQFRLQCLALGIDVQAFIDAIEDPSTQAIAQIRWDEATIIYRPDPLVQQYAAANAMSQQDVDELFIAATALDQPPV